MKSRERRQKLAVAVGGFVFVLIVATFVLQGLLAKSTVPTGSSVSVSGGRLRLRKAEPKTPLHRSQKHRIAIIIPFVGDSGEAIPPYLNLFCTAAAGSASLVDFLIFHNGVLDFYYGEVPSNVKMINVGSTHDFFNKLLQVIDRRSEKELAVESRSLLAKMVARRMFSYPYVLVEFKPALGYIFREYLTEYSHWGYSDLDIVFGDLPRWITADELTDYDIVTYGYGDQDRVYLRGQFTFHKNTDKVNQLWRQCKYLSELDVRFAEFVSGKKKPNTESAEGCYSAVILKQTDLTVKYAVKAFTGIDSHDTAETHGMYLAMGTHRDQSVLYKAGSAQDGQKLLDFPFTWFERKDNVYGGKQGTPLQKAVGSRQKVELDQTKKHSDCMYWVPKQYQSHICLSESGINRTDTVYWINGVLYKETYENVRLPGNVISAPLFHFQEWKRYYRAEQLTTVRLSTDALGWVISKEGAIPLLPSTSHQERKWKSSAILSPLSLNSVQGTLNTHRSHLPHHWYCLRSGPRKVPPRPPAPQCEHSVTWQDEELVELVRDLPSDWKYLDVRHQVTLALTLQITAQQAGSSQALDGALDMVMENVDAWQGQPAVLVMHVAGARAETLTRIRQYFNGDDFDTCLVALINQEGAGNVSRKALMNMAMDAAPTRWVMSGVETERGMLLSSESSLFAQRAANVHSDTTGSVFVVPQFAIRSSDEHRMAFSINDLVEMKRDGQPTIHHPDDFEKGDCEDPNHSSNTIFVSPYDMWWKLSLAEIHGRASFDDVASLRELGLLCDDMQLSFERLLTSKEHFELFALDVSPILMVDSIGPRAGMRTSELAREVEEFGGKQCYNGMRLAQLATFGYRVSMMTGAFAISTDESRKAAFGMVEEKEVGAARCDGCFMFYDDHEDILENIVNDERRRPAKAAVLWNELRRTQ